MAPKKSCKPLQETMVEEPTQDLEDLIKTIREEEQKDFEHEKDCDICGDHENEEEQPNTVLFTPEQLEILLKMNRPDFTELVTALKRRLVEKCGLQARGAWKLRWDLRLEGCRCLACEYGRLHSCHQSWETFCGGTCPILFEGLCLHMVENGEARGREKPWLQMGILQGVH